MPYEEVQHDVAERNNRGAVKKTKEKAASPQNKGSSLFLWYNVIVKKQNPQEYYTAYQLKLPVEIEKIIGHL